MFDFEALVQLGARCSKDAPQSIEVALTTFGLNARLETAMCVEAEYPAFGSVTKLMNKTYSLQKASDLPAIGDMLVEEYLAIQGFVVSGSPILEDANYLALLVGMAGFMERVTEPSQNGARVVADALQACPSPLTGEAQCAMVVMGLWYSDYHGFRGAVARAVDQAVRASA